jgi:hypothetical protein
VRAHVDTLGLAFILYGVAQLIVAAMAGLVFLGVSGMFVAGGVDRSDDGMLVAGGFYGGLGIVAALFAAVMAVPNILVGVGLRQRRRWSWLGGLVCGAMALSQLPFGTVLGVYALRTLLDRDVNTEFHS